MSNNKIIPIDRDKKKKFELEKYFTEVLNGVKDQPEIITNCKVLVSFLIDTTDEIGVHCSFGNLNYVDALALIQLTNSVILNEIDKGTIIS